MEPEKSTEIVLADIMANRAATEERLRICQYIRDYNADVDLVTAIVAGKHNCGQPDLCGLDGGQP